MNTVIAGRYRITSKIGAGGMGVVYKAEQASMDRQVALKVLPQDLDDDALIERFHREAKAASQLRHPNTIILYDFGQHEDILYIAMEFLDGISLSQAIRQGPMDPGRVVNILIQALRSLAEAHRKTIVHRDIKPDNIFLIALDGMVDFVKVLDFGVAKFNRSSEKTLTQAGMIFGTPKYMSPEQARSKNLDARSDVYAIGVMAYEMLTGVVPFDAEEHVSILLKHCTEPIPPFKEMNPDVDIPEDLEQLIYKSMAKRQEDRFQSADEMALALEALAAKYQYIARRSSHLPSLPEPVNTPVPHVSTNNLPPIGKPKPEEVELTPSGSVDWSGGLSLDLGVTGLNQALPDKEVRDDSKLLIAGGVGVFLIVFILAIALFSSIGDDSDDSGASADAGAATTTQTTGDEAVAVEKQQDAATAAAEPDAASSATDAATAEETDKAAAAPDAAEPTPEPVMVELEFVSKPAGAKVKGKDGKELGVTPFTMKTAAGEEAQVFIFTKAGFKPATKKVTPSKNESVSVVLRKRGGGGGGGGGLTDPWKKNP